MVHKPTWQSGTPSKKKRRILTLHEDNVEWWILFDFSDFLFLFCANTYLSKHSHGKGNECQTHIYILVYIKYLCMQNWKSILFSSHFSSRVLILSLTLFYFFLFFFSFFIGCSLHIFFLLHSLVLLSVAIRRKSDRSI